MHAIEAVGLCLPDDGTRRQPWRVRRRRDGAIVLVVCNSRGSWAREDAEAIACEAIAVSLAFGEGDPRRDVPHALERASEEMRDQALDPDWWGPGCEAIAAVLEPARTTVAVAGRCAAVMRTGEEVRRRTTLYANPAPGKSDSPPPHGAERGLLVRSDGSIEPPVPHIEQWPGLEHGDRLLLATGLVAARFAEQGAETLRALLDETSAELRRDPEHVGADGLVGVLARRG